VKRQKASVAPAEHDDALEEAPPVLRTWKNLYLLVLGNLLFWILLLTLFTIIFK
jgi:hypothetical protein